MHVRTTLLTGAPRRPLLGLGWISATVLLFPMTGDAQLPEYVLEPTVRIGSVDDPESALDIVTVLAQAPDGRLAIAQPTEASIWIFSPSGERHQVVGGRGDGPGEFQSISAMGWRGDILWAADGRLFRVTFLDLDGGAPTIVGGPGRQVEGVIRAPLPSEEGLWVLYRRWTLDPELRTYREEIWSADDSWEPLERLAMLPEGPDGFRIQLPGVQHPERRTHPMGEHPLFAVSPDVSTLTTVRREVDRGAYAVTRVRIGGDTVFHREHAVDLEPVTGDTRTAILEQYVSLEALQRLAPSTGALHGAVESALDLPSVHPAVTKLVVGSDGSTWLRGPDDRSGTVRWTVLDSTGEPRFTVRSAREIGMFQGEIETQNLVRMTVDERGIWAVVQDELEVPYVVRYELRPAPSGGG